MTALPEFAVLISGRGRNLQAILDHVAAGNIPARLACVVSNRADADGLARARAAGVATEIVPHKAYADRAAFDSALTAALHKYQPKFIALAGFMRVLGTSFLDAYDGRIVNIHPSLLPNYPGLRTHAQVIAAGDREHGASVHFVTADLDGGPVAIQGRFRVRSDDDETSLAERVMQEVELKIYPQALAWLARGELRYADGRAWFRGHTLAAPLTLADLEPPFRT